LSSFRNYYIEKAKDYAAEDADVTFRLYKKFKKSLQIEKISHIYEIFEKPMIKILSKLETHGIKVDDNYLKELSKKFEKRLEKIEKDLKNL